MTQAVRAGDVISAARRVGADALLVDFSDTTWVTPLDCEVRRRWSGPDSPVRARDVVPAARTLVIDGISVVDAGRAGQPSAGISLGDAARLIAQLRSWTLAPADDEDGATVELPVVFDGPDLREVASLWDVSEADAVARVLACEFRVAFSGFAPGFAYMTGLPAGVAVPRRSSPRTRVPAGAFGLAGEYAGVYPRSSPGGWQILGTAVGVELWDESREPPALLGPGTRVRIVERAPDEVRR